MLARIRVDDGVTIALVCFADDAPATVAGRCPLAIATPIGSYAAWQVPGTPWGGNADTLDEAGWRAMLVLTWLFGAGLGCGTGGDA